MEPFDLDKALKRELHAAAAPPPELNGTLKAALWRRQEQLEAENGTRPVSLWWLPMVANLIVCGVPAVIFALPMMPLWAHLASFALGWLAVGGVALTLIGLHMADLRGATTIRLPRQTRKKRRFES